MRLFIFLTAATLCFANIIQAKALPYSSLQIERHVDKTPRDNENNLLSLTRYLTKPFDNDYDKAKAIAFWIASRIHYDAYLYSDGKASRLIKNYDGQKPAELLRSRVGICGDFADLFIAMCRKAGISAYYVNGYAYPAGQYLTASKRRNAGHAWNYFNYKGDKIYVDTTFMAKGKTARKGSNSQMNRRRAISEIRKENQRKSKANGFDEYYFDFTYKGEKQQRHYVHQEK